MPRADGIASAGHDAILCDISITPQLAETSSRSRQVRVSATDRADCPLFGPEDDETTASSAITEAADTEDGRCSLLAKVGTALQ
jgi:hypothetical protein